MRKTYADSGVIPQALFQHRVTPELSSLKSNVQMMMDDLGDFPEWANHELAPDYKVSEALESMRMALDEVSVIIKEFVDYMDKAGGLISTKRPNIYLEPTTK